MIKVFDFFSGCGGTSCGFQQAGLEVAFGLDNDKDAAATFQRNFPSATFYCEDISKLAADSIRDLVSGNDVLLFCGCAPCQPFSKQNRSRTRVDPRRSLLGEFLRFVEHWLPEYVFVENVPGMQRMEERRNSPFAKFKRRLRALGYSIDSGVLPALWFGVPQARERLVLLASRTPGLSLPEPTHGQGKRSASTVRDWIEGLGALNAGETSRDDPDHRAAALSPQNLQRILATPEGGGRENWPRRLVLDCHKNHVGHSDVYGRLAWDKPASALTTRCVSYSNGRFGHPDQPRAISVREAACIQTFPRSYVFEGSFTSKARQVGNAVPPLMAQSIGGSILNHYRTFHSS